MSYEPPPPPGPPASGPPAGPPPYGPPPYRPPTPAYGPPRSYYAPPPVIPPLAREAYGQWGKRVLASVIDFAPTIVGMIVFLIGYVMVLQTMFAQIDTGARPGDVINAATIVGYAIMILTVPWNLYNRWLTGGRTGQSLGRRVMGLTLLSEQTGRPVGAGMAFLRDLTHVLDSASCYVGYLWPLWDEKRQTFADKLMQTVVLPAPPR